METLAQAKRVVIKIGSALLVDAETGTLRRGWLSGLAEDIAALHAGGADVIVVSSGSIALGRRVLGLSAEALTLDQSQAAAATGQIQLARAYQEVLSPLNITTAQILLTRDDSEDRRRYLNSRATLMQLLSLGVVPIVNENDTVATDEIRFGDNDRLAAQVAGMAGADLLVLLSDVDGLYSANPRQFQDAKHISEVTDITPEIEAMAGGAGSAGAKGGMRTKIMAAKTAMQAGCAMAIARGDQNRPLTAIKNGARATWFVPKETPASARKRWVGAMKPHGDIVIDAGAAQALKAGKSLLPAGVTRVFGEFQRGDMVRVLDEQGHELACGLMAYSSLEADKIKGRNSTEFAEILGYPGRAALIHRDDMVM